MSEIAPSTEHLEKRAKRFWISLVLLLFVVQSIIMGVAIHLATGDRSAVIVPDYHAAALDWDNTKRAYEAAGRLGWEVNLFVSDVADQRGKRVVQWTAKDEQDRFVDGLTVNVRVFHHANASVIQEITLNSVGEGKYMAMADMPQRGVWQVDLEVSGAPEPMAQTMTMEVDS